MSKEISPGKKLKRMHKSSDVYETLSFKSFLKSLGDEPIVKLYLTNKKGNLSVRSDEAQKRIFEQKTASKLARKAKK